MQERCVSIVNKSFDFNYEELSNYIEEKTNGEKFCIVLLIGNSKLRKSTFANSLSNVEHTISKTLRKPTTKGATIAYCGRMCEISKRKKLISGSNDKTHVFVIDTETLTPDLNRKDKVLRFIIPLVSMTSTLVYFQLGFTDITNVNLLEFINTYLPKKGKLIVNVIPEIDVEEGTNLNESNLYEKLIEKGIDHKIVIEKNVLSEVVKISNEIKFNDSEKFIKNLKKNYDSLNHILLKRFCYPQQYEKLVKIQMNTMQKLDEMRKNIENFENISFEISKINEECRNYFITECNKSNFSEDFYSDTFKQINNILNSYQAIANIQIDTKINNQKNELEQKDIIINILNKLSEIFETLGNRYVYQIAYSLQSLNVSEIDDIPNNFEIEAQSYLNKYSSHIYPEIVEGINNDIIQLRKYLEEISNLALSIIKYIQNNKKIKLISKFSDFVTGILATIEIACPVSTLPIAAFTSAVSATLRLITPDSIPIELNMMKPIDTEINEYVHIPLQKLFSNHPEINQQKSFSDIKNLFIKIPNRDYANNFQDLIFNK